MIEFSLSPNISLKNIDCMEFMSTLKDNAFDLAITDPPYFEGPNKPNFYRNGKFSSTLAPAGDYDPLVNWDVPSEDYFKELKRVSKNQIIWGANHFASKFDSSGPGWIVWDKDNGNSSFADAELAYSSFEKAVRVFKFRWNGMLQGYGGNKRKNETRIHSTQKPVALYEWILSKYADKGSKILDTHFGSGSIAIACHRMGFSLTATEIDGVMCRKASERFANETAQMRLVLDGSEVA